MVCYLTPGSQGPDLSTAYNGLQDWEYLPPLKPYDQKEDWILTLPSFENLKPKTTDFALNTRLNKRRANIHRPWGKELISLENSLKKMEKNLIKAWEEHHDIKTHPIPNISAYPKQIISTSSEIVKVTEGKHHNSVEDVHLLTKPHYFKLLEEKDFHITLSSGYAEAKGTRKSMQDAHFCITTPTGTLAGVLDGHGGCEVAKYACNRIQNLFPEMLKLREGNVHQAFELTFYTIQNEIIEKPQFNSIGSTAVCCFFETSTNLIYTATLGDSEAKIYRTIDNEFVSIPLSCVRDWTSKRDQRRVQAGTDGDYIEPAVDYWNNHKISARHRRIEIKKNSILENNRSGINVSRAFGDHAYNIGRPNDVTNAKPKITSCLMEKEDVVVIACDGFYGCPKKVSESEIIERISYFKDDAPEKISQVLVNLAIQKKTNDNVTVVTLKIQ